MASRNAAWVRHVLLLFHVIWTLLHDRVESFMIHRPCGHVDNTLHAWRTKRMVVYAFGTIPSPHNLKSASQITHSRNIEVNASIRSTYDITIRAKSGLCNNQGYPRFVKGRVSARFESKCWSLFLRVLVDIGVLIVSGNASDDSLVPWDQNETNVFGFGLRVTRKCNFLNCISNMTFAEKKK